MDVAFFGDSIAWSGYSPLYLYQKTGIRSYNCSTSGQWIKESYLMLKQIAKTQKLKVAVLDTNLFYVRLMKLKQFRDCIMDDLFPVLQYHGALFEKNNIHERDVWKGYHYADVVTDCSGLMGYMDVDTSEEEIPSVSKMYLEKIYSFCKDNNISLLLCSSPNPMHWNAGKSDVVQKWAEEHQVDYIDGNRKLREIGIDGSTDYIDAGEHLNCNGAEKLTAYVGNYLKDHYQLEDHSGDADWDADLEKAGVYNG